MFTKDSSAALAEEQTQDVLPRPWRWSQHWRDLIFAHWQVPESTLLAHLTAGLELDTSDGTAWVSAIAFHLDRVRPRGLPAIFGRCSSFLELNLRTYVRRHGEPAIFFLRLYADTRLAVAVARCLTPLPYTFARITYDRSGPTRRFDSSYRTGGTWQPLFQAELPSTAGVEQELTDPLDIWLLERYCAYVTDKRGRRFRMRVQHSPWRARHPAVQISADGLGKEWGLDLARPPDRCHVSAGTQALLLPFAEVSLEARE